MRGLEQNLMKRVSITLPNDLAEALESYLQSQEVRPTLAAVVREALREYLQGQGDLRTYKPLKLGPVGNSGRSDISRNHDLYLTGLKK
jgi:Arc/MetJ-type ribon-helix-helix transcriptional regulator